MKMLRIYFMISLMSCASFASDGPIRLVVNPTNLVLRPGQPAVFAFELSNISDIPVDGVFVPLQNGFAGLSVEVTDPLGNKYLFAHNEVVDDIIYNEAILKPGEVLKSSVTILYDMVKNCHVFDLPGEYSVSFVLQWKWREPQQPAVRTTANVEVLDWGQAPTSIVTAKELWMDRDIAYAAQASAELSASSLGRLRKLAKEHPQTVYGRLALGLLARIKEEPKRQTISRGSK